MTESDIGYLGPKKVSYAPGPPGERTGTEQGATDQEKRRCGEILMRSTLGPWDGLKNMGADEAPRRSKWARVEENECNQAQRQ
jgi:hypothetical protein